MPSPPGFSHKVWKDQPDHTTPISAAALEDLEDRVAQFALDTASALGSNFRGVWSSGTTYALGDGVSVGTPPVNYISTVGGNLNHNPVGDGGTHWSPIIPSFVVSGTSSGAPAVYNLGTDAFGNMAIGSTFSSLTPGVTGANQSTSSRGNIAIGQSAAPALVADHDQIAIGRQSMSAMAGGAGNIALGVNSMQNATGGDRNIAIGGTSLQNITGQLFYSATVTTVNGAGQVLSTTPSTLTVASTTGLNSSGSLYVTGVGKLVTYTGTTPTTFTGCTVPSGTYTATNGGVVGPLAGSFNTAIGDQTGFSLTTGYSNILAGSSTGHDLTDAHHCVLMGESTGLGLTSGAVFLTAVGANILNQVAGGLVGQRVTVVGGAAAQKASGNDLVIIGSSAGAVATTGNQNTLVGSQTGAVLTTAGNVTALGYAAGFALTTGSQDTFLGQQAGQAIVTGSGVTCVGASAGRTSSTDNSNMTLLGAGTVGTGDGAVAIGVDNGGTAAAAGANVFTLGTGLHAVRIAGSLKVTGSLGFYGTTPIAQPNTVGSATGYTAGTTAATFHSDDKYVGNVGTTGYTVGGIVTCLKNLGLILS